MLGFVLLSIFLSDFFFPDQLCFVEEFLPYRFYFLFLCWYVWQLLSYLMGIQEEIVPKCMLAFLVAGMWWWKL
jgi:hypothetical protein